LLPPASERTQTNRRCPPKRNTKTSPATADDAFRHGDLTRREREVTADNDRFRSCVRRLVVGCGDVALFPRRALVWLVHRRAPPTGPRIPFNRPPGAMRRSRSLLCGERRRWTSRIFRAPWHVKLVSREPARSLTSSPTPAPSMEQVLSLVGPAAMEFRLRSRWCHGSGRTRVASNVWGFRQFRERQKRRPCRRHSNGSPRHAIAPRSTATNNWQITRRRPWQTCEQW